MGNDLLNLSVNLITTGTMLAFLIAIIWFGVYFATKKKPENAGITNPDIFPNLIKACIYLSAAWVSYRIYTNPKYVSDVKDIVSGFAYILSLLEGVHCMLNSIGLVIVYYINEKRA